MYLCRTDIRPIITKKTKSHYFNSHSRFLDLWIKAPFKLEFDIKIMIDKNEILKFEDFLIKNLTRTVIL